MENRIQGRLFRRRTWEEFRRVVQRVSAKRTYREVAEFLDVNTWHVFQFIHAPDYKPSRKLCYQLGIRKAQGAKRISVHCTNPVSAWRSFGKYTDEEVQKFVLLMLKDKYGFKR